jgi:hypothetical protein
MTAASGRGQPPLMPAAQAEPVPAEPSGGAAAHGHHDRVPPLWLLAGFVKPSPFGH